MTNRTKNEYTITGVEMGTPTEADLLPDELDPDPSFEDRLAELEAQLREQQALINTQAAALVVGAENAERLRTSRARVAKLESRMREAKEEASAAKKAYEAALDAHLSLEADLDSGQARLPFPPEDASTGQPGAFLGTKGPEGDRPAPPAQDENWRDVPLNTLGFRPHLINKFHSANIFTIGDLSDYTQPTPSGSARSLTDIAGIGKVAAERIEAALEEFWARRATAEPTVAVTPADGAPWRGHSLAYLDLDDELSRWLETCGIGTLGALSDALAGREGRSTALADHQEEILLDALAEYVDALDRPAHDDDDDPIGVRYGERGDS